MEKLIFRICAFISSIKYYLYKFFTFDISLNRFRKLPFHSYNASKIYDWQRRERVLDDMYWAGKLENLRNVNRVSINHLDIYQQQEELQKIRDKVIENIKYVSDQINYEKKDHWETTDNIIKKGTGDCEDQAFVMYRRMWEAGFSRNKIGIVCVKGHAFACCHLICQDDFYVLDNGYLTSKVVRASTLFKRGDDLKPIVGFNIGNQWSYR